ncbi:hypothetical protein PsorP6_009612 [Peronosclerospora sorghi]|uniref:Uncharacterized protein n=1 Tax=Peronosclerospora sorghi TaxID=230839 RepID=A0ACC0W1D4_9STRA|nr:hypothetical protein PsorP6_009612 [Peronosclerospora sorghi]
MESAADTLTAKATCAGFLRKQADNEPGAWNEYYFVLKPLTYLFYYNSKDDKTPRGVIDLEYLTDVKLNADCLQRAVGGGNNCFRVSGKLPRPSAEQAAAGDFPKMRPLYLDTDDDEEAEQWMSAIRNHRFNLKKDQKYAEIVQQLRDAERRILHFEETQQREMETNRALRIKAKTLLQKMRAVDSGITDELPEVEIDLDENADDMLAMLEGMEDVLINLQAKLDHQKQEINQMKSDKAGTTSTRRGFTHVLQRAVSKRENTSMMELAESDEEEALAAIRSRRQRKPLDQRTIHEKPKGKPKENPQEKGKPDEKPQEKPPKKAIVKLRVEHVDKPKEKVKEEVAASLDNVSDVLAMWKAKKKKTSSPTSIVDDEDDGSRRNRNPCSRRGMSNAPETDSTRKQKTRGKDRLSEEDTASVDSADERDAGEKLPPGWTRHESRGYPGTYYYAHEDGRVSWDVPTDDSLPSEDSETNVSHDLDTDHDDHGKPDEEDVSDEYGGSTVPHSEEDEADNTTSTEYLSEYESDEETAGGTTSAAYRRQKPKPKSAWAFKLPKLLPTTNQPVPTEATASSSPIRHGPNHHEF